MPYTIKQLAKLANISVRTLHYYDEVGLLSPARRESNDYRQYGEQEMLRLQQILFFRELEFPLDEIKRIMSSPNFDMIAALREHRKMIELKRKRLTGLLATIDNTMKNMSDNTKMNDEELYDAFKDDDVKQYQDEAKQRWGNTDAYKQSQQRVSKMTKAEMQKLKEDGTKHTQAIADAMAQGLAIDSVEVQALIAQSHAGVNFFYECSTEMFRNLGEMYIADPRFTAYYDKFRPGLAAFVRDAINVYCDKKEGK